MRKCAGFTLVELMIVIAILGILSTTALTCFGTLRQRANGSEAHLMLHEILDAQIIYFLKHEKFFPDPGKTIMIFHNDSPSNPQIRQTSDLLKANIPVGHFLDFIITTLPDQTCMVTISSFDNSFGLSGNSTSSITGLIDCTGKIDIL